MSGSLPPLLQYAFMAWCSVKEKRQLYIYREVYQRKKFRMTEESKVATGGWIN
jgi:hypothetical protein